MTSDPAHSYPPVLFSDIVCANPNHAYERLQ